MFEWYLAILLENCLIGKAIDDVFFLFIILFMFNVYVQPYGYDRPFVFPFPLTPIRLTPFFFSISALSRRLYCIVTVRPLGCLPS